MEKIERKTGIGFTTIGMALAGLLFVLCLGLSACSENGDSTLQPADQSQEQADDAVGDAAVQGESSAVESTGEAAAMQKGTAAPESTTEPAPEQSAPAESADAPAAETTPAN